MFLNETRGAVRVHLSLELPHLNEIEMEEYLFFKILKY